MFRHQLGYRYQSNDVAGFIGYGFTPEAAEAAAKTKPREACQIRDEPFDPARLIVSEDGLTDEEIKTIKLDWKKELDFRKHRGDAII